MAAKDKTDDTPPTDTATAAPIDTAPAADTDTPPAASAGDDVLQQLAIVTGERDVLQARLDAIAGAITDHDLHHGTPGDVADVATARLADHRALLDRVAAMPAGGAAALATDRVSFDLDGVGMDAADLWSFVTEQATYILPGDDHGHLTALPRIVAQPKEWKRTGDRIEFTGEFNLTGPGGVAIELSRFGLANGPDGPVVAVADAGGKAMLREGTSFKYGPGTVVFDV